MITFEQSVEIYFILGFAVSLVAMVIRSVNFKYYSEDDYMLEIFRFFGILMIYPVFFPYILAKVIGWLRSKI